MRSGLSSRPKTRHQDLNIKSPRMQMTGRLPNPNSQLHIQERSPRYLLAICGIISLGLLPGLSWSEQPQDFLNLYLEQCRHDNPGFTSFDASRGETLFKTRQGNEWSCSTCHTDDPRGPGQHCETRKSIQPMAPTANADRFKDPLKVEKWFKRSCKDVLGRECTPQEKGDILSYLTSLR